MWGGSGSWGSKWWSGTDRSDMSVKRWAGKGSKGCGYLRAEGSSARSGQIEALSKGAGPEGGKALCWRQREKAELGLEVRCPKSVSLGSSVNRKIHVQLPEGCLIPWLVAPASILKASSGTLPFSLHLCLHLTLLLPPYETLWLP